MSLPYSFLLPRPASTLPADFSHCISSLPEPIALAACSCLQPLTLASLPELVTKLFPPLQAHPAQFLPLPLSPFGAFPVTSIFSSFCPLVCFSLLPSPTHKQLGCLLGFLALLPPEIPWQPSLILHQSHDALTVLWTLEFAGTPLASTIHLPSLQPPPRVLMLIYFPSSCVVHSILPGTQVTQKS